MFSFIDYESNEVNSIVKGENTIYFSFFFLFIYNDWSVLNGRDVCDEKLKTLINTFCVDLTTFTIEIVHATNTNEKTHDVLLNN